MSYSTRVYRQRNAHTPDDTKEQSSFFSKANGPPFSQGSKPSLFPAKLVIGQPNDKYEKEADAAANRVVNNQNGNSAVVQQKNISSIQRLSTSMEDEKPGTNDARMRKGKEIQEKPEVQMKCASCEKEKKQWVELCRLNQQEATLLLHSCLPKLKVLPEMETLCQQKHYRK